MSRATTRKAFVAAAAVLVCLAATALPASAALTIDAKLAASTITLGSTAEVTGEVNVPSDSINVVLQRNVGGVWTDRNTAAVNADGTFKITLKPSQTGTYTLRVRSIGGGVVSRTLTLNVTRKPEIRVVMSSPTTAPGAPVTIIGKIDPAGATARVVLQRSVAGRWSDRAGALTNRETGEFTISVTPSTAGTYVLRVRSNGGTVVSRTLYLRVLPVVSD